MSLTANLSAIRGNQPGTVFRQFKDECTVMINYVQNLLQKGTDVMSSLRQEHDTQATSLMINYAGIEKLRSLLDKIQRINNFALDLGSDDETENSISNAVSSTLVESSRATINPTFNDDSRAAINSAFDESSRAVVNPSFEEFSLVSCNVQVGDILDMIYLSGNNPYRFWLRYYSTTKLDEVMQILTTRSQNGDLRPCRKPYRGQHVCVYDGQQCYRAKIINIFDKESEVEISVLNIDNGKQFKVKERTIYHLDSDVLNIPVQGLCCRLQGSLGDSNLWNDVVASLFSQVLTNSNLVVTVTAKLPENPPQFVVDIDCHNEERRINKLELSKWVTATVFPKLYEVKQKSLPINRETLNTLFTYLDPVTAVEQATSNEEEFASNACALNLNLQQLSISKDKRKSHSNDTRSAMALELASTSKVENSRCVLDWNLPQNGALPTPITPNVEKSLVSQRQMTVYTAQKKQPTSPDKCKTYVQIANCRNIEVISTYKRSSSGSKTLPVSPSATINHQITSNSKLQDSSSFVVGNGLSKKLEPEKCDYDLLQPVLVYTAGQIYDAMLAYVENPAEFYVHIVCEENVKIDDLHAGMNDFYNSLKACFKSKSEAKKYIGKYCAAYYALDHQWCRALIIDWNEARDDLDVIVKFVDYGNVSPVPLALVQPLRKRFTALPICAQRCHLANIHPVESTKENILTTWSNQSANLFKCLIDVNAVYSIILTESSNGSSASLPVLLKFNHNDNDSMINKSMVELGYAVHFSPIDIPLYFNPNEKAVVKSNDVQTETKVSKNAVIEDENSVRVDDVQIETKVSKNVVKEDENSVRVDLLQNDSDRRILVWDPMAEDYYSEVNTMYHDDENASYVVTGYKPKDEKRVCKLYATKGYCYKGPTCLKEHTLLNPDGWTTDREAVFVTAYNELLLPAAGSDILLNVTLIVKSNVFWAFVVDDLTGMTKRAQTEAANAEVLEETLATLTLYMNQDSNVKKLQPLTVAPAVGQLVVARFMDGLYYRARVVDFDLDKYEVRVLFVDYGNVEWLKMSDVRDIEPRYLHLPFQAVECMIANVEALPGDKLGRGSLILNELLRHMEHVHARVVLSSNDECRMEVLIFDDEGNDLGNKLIQAGVCTQRRLKVPVSQKSITVLPG